uniref:Fucosyltransferase n=1 Tax=Caenorhabditis japonica TaxID=281687 RepID=A0A8R1I820_CAEJA
MVGGATFSWRYAGRFVTLAVYASIAFLLWCTFGPTRSQNEFPLYDDSVATHRKPPNLSISPNKTYSETIAIQSDETRVQPARIATRNVVIYAATKFFGHPITTERFLATCPDVQKYCRITQDEAEFANSDAVLFHNADYHGESSFKHLVKQRKPGVPFVLWSLESPSNDNFRPGSGEYLFISVYLVYFQSSCDVPDSAYIAVDDFETFDKFLEHVKKVNKDKELYLKYHEWRKEWKIVIGSGFSGWCTLCDKLQDKEYILSHPKSYHDVAWWHSFEMCNNQIAQKYL